MRNMVIIMKPRKRIACGLSSAFSLEWSKTMMRNPSEAAAICRQS